MSNADHYSICAVLSFVAATFFAMVGKMDIATYLVLQSILMNMLKVEKIKEQKDNEKKEQSELQEMIDSHR